MDLSPVEQEPTDEDRPGLLPHGDHAEEPPRTAAYPGGRGVVEDQDAVRVRNLDVSRKVVGNREVVEVGARLVLNPQLHALDRLAGPVSEGDAVLLLVPAAVPNDPGKARGQQSEQNG